MKDVVGNTGAVAILKSHAAAGSKGKGGNKSSAEGCLLEEKIQVKRVSSPYICIIKITLLASCRKVDDDDDDDDHGGGILKAVRNTVSECFRLTTHRIPPEKVDVARDLSAFASDGTTWLRKDDGGPLLGEVGVYHGIPKLTGVCFK